MGEDLREDQGERGAGSDRGIQGCHLQLSLENHPTPYG